MSSDRWYRLKKTWPVYPGALRPIHPAPLTEFYAQGRRRRWRIKAAADTVVFAALWLGAPWRARRIARKAGLDRDWTRRATALARRKLIDPQEIALLDIREPADADSVIRRFEFTPINRRINPKNWAADCALTDKILFAARCAARDLPHAPIIAHDRGGAVTVLRDPAGGEMFVKPLGGASAKNVSILPAPGSPPDAAWFAAHAPLRRDWIAQRRLRPHARLQRLAGAALLTARVTTMLNEAGAAEMVNFVFRLPLDLGRIADNRGLVAPVDPDTGRLGRALHLWITGDPSARFSRHPVNGEQIEGVILPDWDKVAPLATTAHETAFGDYTMIGWDIGFSADGLVLVEGNGKPSILLAQRAGGGAWSTRLGDLIAFHLARAAQ